MKQITSQDVSEFKTFIESHDFFFVAGHKEPDGDCIASCLAVASILDNFSKPYQLLSAGPFKRNEMHFEVQKRTRVQVINPKKGKGSFKRNKRVKEDE